ncbi:hypothetical protein LY76DRAFT_58675 [Colletotrichum caudatum]|nr:hypothetical protein LY76DRAFT_58675 [Colletotrichum caudatum]
MNGHRQGPGSGSGQARGPCHVYHTRGARARESEHTSPPLCRIVGILSLFPGPHTPEAQSRSSPTNIPNAGLGSLCRARTPCPPLPWQACFKAGGAATGVLLLARSLALSLLFLSLSRLMARAYLIPKSPVVNERPRAAAPEKHQTAHPYISMGRK